MMQVCFSTFRAALHSNYSATRRNREPCIFSPVYGTVSPRSAHLLMILDFLGVSPSLTGRLLCFFGHSSYVSARFIMSFANSSPD